MALRKSNKEKKAEAAAAAAKNKEKEAAAIAAAAAEDTEAAAAAAAEDTEDAVAAAAAEADADVEAAKQDEPAPVAEEGPKAGDDVVIPHAEMVMPDEMPSYRVSEEWHGSLNGGVCTLAKGKLLNPRLYGGMPGIEKLKKAGVSLEEVQ